MTSTNDDRQGIRRPVLPLNSKPPDRRSARLVGKMISHKQIKSNVVFTVLKAAWAGYGSFTMSELAEGVQEFEFEKLGDRDRVLDMSP